MTTTVQTSARPAPASTSRSKTARVLQTFEAYLRIDVIEDWMFPAGTVLRYVAVLVPVLMYFFQAKYLGTQEQFAATLVGVSVAAALQDSLTGCPGRMQYAQERGTLETYLVEPVPWRLVPIAMNVWRSLTGFVIALVMLGVGVALGADIRLGNLPAFLVVLLLGSVACNALGILAASFLALFKRGEPIIVLYGLAASFLGGALFPIDVLPPWIRWASYLVPHAYVISAERKILVPDVAGSALSLPTALVCLVVFCVVGLWVGIRVFDRSLRYARDLGILST
ncbi:MAG: ABC transporter permease [Motilibacteraceae bacterium]